MTLQTTVTCDQTRGGGNPCRAAMHIPTMNPIVAGQAAGMAGWQLMPDGSHRCPSKGHDGQEPSS